MPIKNKRSLENGGKRERANAAKAANARERNIAKHYLNAGPNIINLVKAAYHWYNSVPMLGGQNESGLIISKGDVPTPGMRSPKAIVKSIKTITKANASKITPAQWTAAQDAAIARGDISEAQRLRDLHFKVNAPNTKVVDVEGNPRHIYHGGQKNITKFLNPNEFDASIKLNNYYKNGKNRVGIYTSDWKSYANQYARGYKKKNRNVYDLYANIENPRYVSYWESKLNRLRNLNPFRKKDFLNPSVIRPEHKEELLKGYDGVKWDVENVVFDGKQLKSADAVTYDNKGIRIPLGERDNFNINDIRYALMPFVVGVTGYGIYNRAKKRNGGSIHIAPSKRGTFTAAATKHGMRVQEFASKVLRNKNSYSPAMVKKANFARNASKWNS